MIWTHLSAMELILTFCICIMTIAWAIATKKKFLSVVDVVWAFGISGCSLILAFLGSSPLFRRILCAGLVTFWGVRLGSHLTFRLVRRYPKEDPRYESLREAWGSKTKFYSFLFFQFQALSQVLLSYPVLVAVFNESTVWSWSETLATLLVALGICGETLADSQLRRFNAKPENHNQVCQAGLWRFSRHPNYFFEWIIWCGFGFLGLDAPGGFFSLLCPAMMLILLLFITGVPPAEESSLRSRGQAYKYYQSTTSKFFPWWPKPSSKKGIDYAR